MIKQNHISSEDSFRLWVWREPGNRLYILLSGIFSLLAFIWLKWQYPYPNFLPDSYSYLDAAFLNRGINMWPIGYSGFLRILSTFTHSDTALVFIQYILLQAGILYFLFSLRYFFRPGKWTFRVLVACCIANPISLYISNYVSSDALFATISLIWITQLLWIAYRPHTDLLILHCFVVTFAFIIRYNALYYPLISLAVILASPIRAVKKIIASASLSLLLGCFILVNLAKYKHLTGTSQFSAFGGWQLASNALFAYAHITPDAPDRVPDKFRGLQRIVNWHMDSLSRLINRPDRQLGAYYLWDEHSPLKEYLSLKWKNDSAADTFKNWASMGPLYAAYGSWLIHRHPDNFVIHYIWPNMINYYVPNTEFMNIYNMGKDSVEELAKDWFGYKSTKIIARTRHMASLDIYPVLLAIINLLFVLCFTCFWLLDGFKKSSPFFSKTVRWIAIIWLSNFCFSVLASPIVLRYQIFPMIITFTFLGLLLDFIMRESRIIKYPDQLTDKYEKYSSFIRTGQPGRML